jgi:hypothetical protein
MFRSLASSDSSGTTTITRPEKVVERLVEPQFQHLSPVVMALHSLHALSLRCPHLFAGGFGASCCSIHSSLPK